MTFLTIILVLALLISLLALNHSVKTRNTIQRDFATKEKLKEWAEMSCKMRDQFNELRIRFDKTHLWCIKAYIQNAQLSYFDEEAKKGEVYEMKSTIVKDNFTFEKGDRVLIESGKRTLVTNETILTIMNPIGQKIKVNLLACPHIFVTQKEYEDRIDEANYMLDKELEAIGDDTLIADLMDQNHVLIKENERLTKEIDKCCKLNQELSRKLSVVPSPPKRKKK